MDESIHLSVKDNSSDFSLAPAERRKADRRRKREARHTEREIGLHLFAWSSRDTIILDACRLLLRLRSSVVPVYPWETCSGRQRLRQAHTNTQRPLQLHLFCVC